MNLAIRRIDADLASEKADTFHHDLHPDLRADYVLANPPCNISNRGGERLQGDRRWQYGTPPAGNANYAWLQHILYHLAPNGTAGVVLANGSLSSNQSGKGQEGRPLRVRSGQVLFIDACDLGPAAAQGARIRQTPKVLAPKHYATHMQRAENNKHDLRYLIEELIKRHPQIESIHIFGSRAYKTGSLRSDCDILVSVPDGINLPAYSLSDFSATYCEFLDLFIVRGGHATSCINNSYIYATDRESLIEKLDAILLWDKNSGFKENNNTIWSFETHPFVTAVATVLPDAAISEISWQNVRKRTEQSNLPLEPFIGDDILKASNFIMMIASRMILDNSFLAQRGKAPNGWTVNISSEYDCQNLFITVVKPWIPDLAREQIAIIYDGQQKFSDFSLFSGQLVIEMKFIDSNGKKSEVVKTLSGLREFYSQNSNVRVLLFLIYVKIGIQIDDRAWSANYTYRMHSPEVITQVIRVP